VTLEKRREAVALDQREKGGPREGVGADGGAGSVEADAHEAEDESKLRRETREGREGGMGCGWNGNRHATRKRKDIAEKTRRESAGNLPKAAGAAAKVES